MTNGNQPKSQKGRNDPQLLLRMLGGPNAVHVLPILHNGHSMLATSKRETDLLGGTLKHSPSHHGRPMPSLAEAGLIWMVQIYGISWLGNH